MKEYKGNGEFQEIGEDTVLGISIKTLIALAVGLFVAVGGYYNLQAEIDIAKKLPEPAVSRTEYDLKDQLIRETIINTQAQVEENGKKLDLIEQRLYNLSTNE